ncbi:hypothetical protein FACS1894186_5890 [Alphaproteobacteria bacterium]|nr:hypothetical protein FACS1894186_5890 [Alphaproteobacteria bacterium]
MTKMEDRHFFRFWVPDKKVMVYPDTSELGITYYNEAAGIMRPDSYPKSLSDMLAFSIGEEALEFLNVPMQCTGLRDKSGKLIWEGDIILWDNRYNSTSHPEYLTIVYQQMFTRFIGSRSNNQGLYDLSRAEETMKVIGNIYETPELLEAPHE